MALSRFTMTFFRDMLMAPFERQTVTIIGSISGVRPTATARAKKKASLGSPLVAQLMAKTNGAMIDKSTIISQVKRVTPRSNALTTC